MAQLTYRESVSLAIAQAMRKDPKVFFIGEDVGAAGGVFKAQWDFSMNLEKIE